MFKKDATYGKHVKLQGGWYVGPRMLGSYISPVQKMIQ